LARRRASKSRIGRQAPRRREVKPVQKPGQGAAHRLESDILALLYQAGQPRSDKDIFKELDLARKYRHELQVVLEHLCRRHLVTCRKGTYKLPAKNDLVEGGLSVNPRGFGFVTVENPPPHLTIEQDIFVPPGMLGSAAHEDRVLLQIIGKNRGRFEARVIKVLSRATTMLVGVYTAGGSTGLVIPEDDRFPYNLVIRREYSCGAKNGDAVLAEVISFESGQRNLDGKIIEVLGNPDDIQVQTEMVIRKFQLPHVFDQRVEQQVAALDPQVTLTAERTDLRDVAHVTIDGETARDFDDAVAVESLPKGYRLYVSIADVSHYVRPGTPVDQEAYARGTSVYFPTRVLPMLPERLSNNLCSLVPNEARYTFTAVLDFDKTGKMVGKNFMKSIIKSRHRLTYTIVKEMLVDRAEAQLAKYADILPDIELMGELALLLEARRMQRGSIGFEIPEPVVVLSPDDKVENVVRAERNRAHKLIEEFMLAANEAVAEAMAQRKIDSLYRVHETPDPLKVTEFVEFISGMGIKLPEGGGSPQWFGKVLELTADSPQEYIVSNLLLRTMKQARYTAENLGHFGLAATHYTHFTSPIRRYPDLMVHRALAANLLGRAPEKGVEYADTEEAGLFLSKRERVAVDADREMVARLQVRFMADKIGESFEAVVSGVTSFGLFVELIDVFISGAVAITDMSDDYYHHDEERHRLVGERRGNIYQLGNLIRVTLTGVEVARRRINFKIAENLDGIESV